MILNFTALFVPEVPSRKTSYFATSDASNANSFGEIYVVIPHDSIANFALVPDDFNLRHNPILKKISSAASDYAGFGYEFWLSIISITQIAKSRLDDVHAAELLEVAKKIHKEQDVTKQDFDDFDRVFAKVMSNPRMNEITDLPDSGQKLALFVWEVVSSEYDGSFSKFLRAVVREGNKEIQVMGFKEAIEFIKAQNHQGVDYEIWFDGGCSYFSVNWISEKLAKEMDDEDFSIVDNSNDMQDYAEYISSFLSRYVKEQ